MAESSPLESGPSPTELDSVFTVYETRTDGNRLLYYGDPLVDRETVLQTAWPLFREYGYEVTLSHRTGEFVLVAEPIDVGVDGIPWTNVILAVATLLSTLYAGSMWYYVRDPIGDPFSVLTAWPFAVAVLGILGIHELGHYVLSRYHHVDASLPYFIPMPTIIGTMGAVIKMRGQMPDRKALFDIGVSGPLAGLVATIIVTAIGLSMPPIDVPTWVDPGGPNTLEIGFGKPLLFTIIATAIGQEAVYKNPVVIAGWVGMFVTFLNLLPVGQLDGGHIVRALVGKRQATVAAIIPGILFGLAGVLYYFSDWFPAGNVHSAIGLWSFWGLLALVFAYAGPARPIREESLDGSRKIIGLVTLILGLLCFTPVPIWFVP